MTEKPLTKYTKRAHLLLCSSNVSCNNPNKGRVGFDPDALKKRWREEGHSKLCCLQITGCMGMCDLGNSGCLILPDRTVWLGGLTPDHHEVLMSWLAARQDLLAGLSLLPLPEVIQAQEVRRLDDRAYVRG